MAESNLGSTLTKDLGKMHLTALACQHPIIIVNGDKDKNKIFEEMLAQYSGASKRPVHVFSSADDLCNFVENELYFDEYAKCVVIATDQLAYDIIPDIVHCKQIEEIIILDNHQPSQQDRESMKAYSKVRE